MPLCLLARQESQVVRLIYPPIKAASTAGLLQQLSCLRVSDGHANVFCIDSSACATNGSGSLLVYPPSIKQLVHCHSYLACLYDAGQTHQICLAPVITACMSARPGCLQAVALEALLEALQCQEEAQEILVQAQQVEPCCVTLVHVCQNCLSWVVQQEGLRGLLQKLQITELDKIPSACFRTCCRLCC